MKQALSSTAADTVLDLRREYVVAGLDGAITQADATIRFLGLGADKEAAAAFQRTIDFVKLAAVEMKVIAATDDKVTTEGAA